MIRPDKCVTLVVFDGKKIHRIELIAGWTKSISEGATKFFGATIATSISPQLQQLRNNWRRSPWP